MLRSLDIRDMLIIDRLELAFQPGLNVLTGETGAGKSILLDALGFVLGWRGRAELVREGADQGEVVAVFDLPGDHPAQEVLREAGIDASDGELILRRVNSLDGRKTAWVNDRRASGEVLRALSDTLVELHGQQDDRGLLNPRGHRALLDDFGGLGKAVAETRAAWMAWRKAGAAFAEAQQALAAMREEEDFLRHAARELDDIAPEAGEAEDLDARRRLMQAAARIGEDVNRAAQAISREGAEGAMADALRWLEGAAEKAEGALDAGISALGRALNELAEAQGEVETALDWLAFDPGELERTEERLFALRALARKHGVGVDDLAELAEDFRAKLAALDQSGSNLAELEATEKAAAAAYDAAAARLSAQRAKAGAALDKAMAGELAPLKMEAATFLTVVEPGEAGPEGADQVTFTVATNPGAPAGPLGKIASGGELSRFLLALKVCLTQGASGLVMIFDEIDRGVGGATANAVGRRLARLAEGGQVLVVTHSPQVAALGAHHWQVAKSVSKGQTLSRVTALESGARVDEIARMLAGDTVTEEARSAAKALLTGE